MEMKEEHNKFYLPDGDIALAVKASPTTTHVFRVHKVVLANASPIFRDMFALAGPVAEENYDGVPLVRMPDGDHAADFELLFDVMYNISRFYELMSMPKANLPLELGGLARLAQKYMVQDITSVIVKCVEDSWPKLLHRWDELFAFREWANTDCPTARTPHILGVTLDDFPEPVSSINFAFEHDIALPAALYKLCITSPESHWPHNDNPPHWKWPCFRKDMHHPSARWRLLSREALSAFIIARETLHQEFKTQLGVLRAHVSGLSATRFCEGDRATCGAYLMAIFAELQAYVFSEWRQDMDCLQMLEALNDRVMSFTPADGTELCQRCRIGLYNKADIYARGEIWDKLEEDIWPTFKAAALALS